MNDVTSPAVRLSRAPRLAAWPRRRWVVAALAAGPLGAAFLAAGGGGGAPWWGWAIALVGGLLGGLLLASYVAAPGAGRLVDVGCSPCAAAAGSTLLLALLARAGAPDNVGMAVLGLALLAGGLRQRLGDASSCGFDGGVGRYPRG
ncbi:MAG: hypothetical protein ACTHQ3_05345 [Motilibacteraceae bacterium]